MGDGTKRFIFLALSVTVAILLVEPLVEKGLLAISPTTAAKLGVTA